MESEDHGAEIFFQKKKGKTTGWGYTLSYSERKFEGVNLENEYPINLTEDMIFL